MIIVGRNRFRARYRQVGEPGQTGFRSAQRMGTGRSASLRRPALSAIGKAGDSPANWRKRLRTWPKLIPGSSRWTSPKTSPLASLMGSHQPRPPWLTIRISPSPRRYFRLSLVLSFRSSSKAAACARARRRNAPCRAARRFPDHSWSLLPFGCRSWAVWPWAGLRPCPSRRPRGGRAARARGTRGSLRRTLVGAAGASGSHPPLPRSSGEVRGPPLRSRRRGSS